MSTHLGQLVKSVAKEKGVKFTWLAKELHMSRQNLNSIFQRKALDVSLLQKLSLILDYNFFEFVTPEKFKHSDDSARQPNTEEPERIPDYSASRKPRITVQIAIDDPSVEKKVLQLVLDEEQIKKLGLHSGD